MFWERYRKRERTRVKQRANDINGVCALTMVALHCDRCTSLACISLALSSAGWDKHVLFNTKIHNYSQTCLTIHIAIEPNDRRTYYTSIAWNAILMRAQEDTGLVVTPYNNSNTKNIISFHRSMYFFHLCCCFFFFAVLSSSSVFTCVCKCLCLGSANC